MWFKNVRVYQLNTPFEHDAAALHEKLEAAAFQPCGKHDERRSGWVPPLGRHGVECVHPVGHCIAIALRTEQKILPPAVIREALEQRVIEIEEQEQREVGRRERLDLKDEIIFSLKPLAFSKSVITHAYIDVRHQRVVVNASSAARAEELLTTLRDALGSLPCVPLQPLQPVASVMTDWLRRRGTGCELELGEECELVATDGGGVVKVKHQDLTADEVLGHLNTGMVVKKLALNWKEGSSLLLDEQFAIKRLRFGEAVDRAETGEAETAAEVFDQEFAVMSVEIGGLLEALLSAFGGLDAETRAA